MSFIDDAVISLTEAFDGDLAAVVENVTINSKKNTGHNSRIGEPKKEDVLYSGRGIILDLIEQEVKKYEVKVQDKKLITITNEWTKDDIQFVISVDDIVTDSKSKKWVVVTTKDIKGTATLSLISAVI